MNINSILIIHHRTTTQFELESLKKSKEIQQLQHELNLSAKLLEAETKHKTIMHEQEQLLERKKLEKKVCL